MTKQRSRAFGPLKSLQFSGYTLVLLLVLALAGASFTGAISVFTKQRQEIGLLKQQLRETETRAAKQKQQLNNWEDPAFIKAQARDRLFYVVPGEYQLGIIADVPLPTDAKQVESAKLTKIERDWGANLLAAFLLAGTPDAAASDTKK